MKLTDLKHDHSLTNLLKVLIFSILMLTPFFYVTTKCLYVVCNKNAYESYYGETINEETYTNKKINTFSIGDDVYVDTYNNFTIPERTGNPDLKFAISNLQMITTNINVDLSNTNYISFYSYDNNTQLWIVFYNDNTTLLTRNLVNVNLIFKFTYQGFNTGGQSYIDNLLFFNLIEYNNYSYLDNVFEYSVNQMAQSQLFTWTQNTGVYTGANAMTTGLGLTSPVIPILISYWFLLTIIYVVIDIVIVCFTTITHMIVKKSN